MLKILIYLFENCVNNTMGLLVNHEKLALELEQAGYDSNEVQQAFIWLEDILVNRRQNLEKFKQSKGIRIYADVEARRLSVESRRLIHFLELCHMIDAPTRELIIDRALALDVPIIQVEHIRWVILLVMLNTHAQQAIMAWMGKNQMVIPSLDTP